MTYRMSFEGRIRYRDADRATEALADLTPPKLMDSVFGPARSGLEQQGQRIAVKLKLTAPASLYRPSVDLLCELTNPATSAKIACEFEGDAPIYITAGGQLHSRLAFERTPEQKEWERVKKGDPDAIKARLARTPAKRLFRMLVLSKKATTVLLEQGERPDRKALEAAIREGTPQVLGLLASSGAFSERQLTDVACAVIENRARQPARQPYVNALIRSGASREAIIERVGREVFKQYVRWS